MRPRPSALLFLFSSAMSATALAEPPSQPSQPAPTTSGDSATFLEARGDAGAPQTPPAPSAEGGEAWQTSPTSRSGNALLPPATDTAAAERIAALEARVQADEEDARRRAEEAPKDAWYDRVKLSGYLQLQGIDTFSNRAGSPNLAVQGPVAATASPNTTLLLPDGTTTNRFFFRIRRGRIRVDATPVKDTFFTFEFEPLASGGVGNANRTVARNIEAGAIAHFSRDVRASFSAGMFKVPFGDEVAESDPDRPFIERSFTEQSLFPAEFDTGARVKLQAADDHFMFHAAVLNGTTLGERTFTLIPDMDKGKDVVVHVHWDQGIVLLGASALFGEGQIADTTTLQYATFARRGFDLEFHAEGPLFPTLGGTRLLAEAIVARDLDRGVAYSFALPSFSAPGADLVHKTERGGFVRLEQDLGKYLTLAVRGEAYTPDTSVTDDSRSGGTFVAVLHATRAYQLMAEYDHFVDHLHAAGPSVLVPDRQYDIASLTAQGRF